MTETAARIAVIEQTHAWGDCSKQGERRDHCHCALEVSAIRSAETRTCRHCGIAEHAPSHANPVTTTEEPAMNATATTVRFDAVRINGRWKVQDAATGETVTCASRAKAEERAAKLNAAEAVPAGACEVCREPYITADDHTDCDALRAPERAARGEAALAEVKAEATAVSPVSGAAVPVETALEESAAIFAETGILTAVEAAEPAIKEMAAEVRARLLAEEVNAGRMTFAEAAAKLPAAPAAEKAEPMKSLWVAAAFVPIILADGTPGRGTLVYKVDQAVPNNRGGRTVRLTRAEAEELAAIGTEIENSVNGAGRMAHSARTMRDRLAALWA